MADVRCPMCSTPNPEDRDTCKVCGARLTPLTNDIAQGNIESIHPGDQPTRKSTAELEHALPDWLQDLRKKPETGELLTPSPAVTPSAPQPAPSSSETDEDFLSRLASESTQENTPAAQPESTDWLAGLSDARVGDEDIPDWLLGVKKSVDEEAESAKLAAASQPAADNVDWFQRLQEDQKASQGGDASQWPGYYNEPPGFGKSGQDETLISKPDSADWFMPASDGKAPEPADTSRPTGVTDWLKKMKTQGAESGASIPQTATPAESGSAPLPDWLAFVQPAAPEAESPAPAAIPGEIPDWLTDFKADQPAAADLPTSASTPAEGLPDWLMSAQPAQSPAPVTPPSQPAQAEPDWLSTFGGSQAVEPSPAAVPASNELPNWLTAAEAGIVGAGVLNPDEKKTAELPRGLPGSAIPAASQPAEDVFELPPVTISGDEDLPDWLSDLPGAPGPAAPVKKPTAPLPPVPVAGEQPPAEKSKTPDWRAGAAAAAATAASAKAVSAFTDQPMAGEDAFAMEMPDWLSGVTPAETATAAAALPGEPTAGGSESLTPGELPAWVQAMRPVEAVIAETAGDVDDEQFVESQGPLAGFQNVLPFVPGLIAIRRPGVYSSKLQVNAGQQNNAALLEGLLSTESDAAKVKHKSHLHYNKFLRWMIASLLIILVAIPIVLRSTLTPINNLYPPELLAANEVIKSLPSNPNVLVVFDYEPAFSGEMTTASAPVIGQLMAKGATLTAVSSLPTGSVQANLLLTTYLSSYNYLGSDSFINLGYIPGGAAGIYNFATNPAETIPVDVEGNPVWSGSSSFLADTSQLSDFDAMVILVDGSETAQVWIEQSRLPLETTPLLMVISAQSEPMILPYYDSKQVQGMVTGLFGGAYYEQITASPATARLFWDAFAVAFFVAEVIIVVGGIWALIAAWQSRLARKEEEA
jgi:hypothetical protein